MSTADYTSIVGVFRDHTQADAAVDALKQAGFREDQVQLTEYTAIAAGVADMQRFVVHVHTDDREQEANAILFRCGANNGDLPPGTILLHGSIISSNPETVDLIPAQPPDEFAAHTFFEEAKEPEHPDEIAHSG